MTTRLKLLSALSVLVWFAGCDDDFPPLPESTASSPRELTPTPEVWLDVLAFQLPASSFNNPAAITMWGYASCTRDFMTCDSPTAPGPELTVMEGTSLTVHLRNSLVGAWVEPTSLVVPGQLAAMAPVWVDPVTGIVTAVGARAAGDTSSRVRSFNTEVPADGATVVTFVFSGLRAGSYLYQSGTHPAVQVQMGLAGALKVYPNIAGRAYSDPTSTFFTEVTLVFSEVDSSLHAAVAAGRYGPNPNAPGTPPTGWLSSTIGYHPDFFLVNGRPFSSTRAPLAGGAPNQRLLLRFLNAGLETRVLALQGPYMSVLAEDGEFFTALDATGSVLAAPREQYSVLLPAGKTADAVLTPTQVGDLVVYDRSLHLSNAGVAPGGLYAYLSVGPQGLSQGQALQPSPQVLNIFSTGSQPATALLMLTNTGLSPRVITGVSFSAVGRRGDATAFSASLAGPLVLPGGARAVVPVTFRPNQGGVTTAFIAFETNDPTAPRISSGLRGVAQ